MLAAVSTAINPKTATQRGHPHNPTRSPLLPSEPDNALSPPPRKPKAREVTSRYMRSSSSSSNSSYSSSNLSSIARRCHSPLLSRTANSTVMMTSTPSLTERSKSVERRSQAPPRSNSFYAGMGNGGGGTNTPAAQKMLFTSTRSLSVSFQGESFSIQVSKAKPAPAPNLRRSTPERRKVTTPARLGNVGSDQTENSRLMDQQRWPGRMRQGNCTSMDCAEERQILGGSGDVNKSLQNLMVDVQSSFDGTTSLEVGNGQVRKTDKTVLGKNKANGCVLHGEPFASDNESVSSGGSPGSGAHDYGRDAGGEGQRLPHGIAVPERFWQETKSRLGRQTDQVSPSSWNTGNKVLAPPKLPAPRKLVFDSISSPRGVVNSRGQVSPIRASARPVTPNKLASQPTSSITSPYRGLSPSRVRNGVAGGVNNTLSNVPSILSFSVDIQRAKIGENRIVDAHLLRLLYNRLLQWRFINARADVALSSQILNAEKSLSDAWVATSKLHESVRAKRMELQLLKQHFKLSSIVKKQMIYLEDWALLDRGYSSSLSGAIEALRASTLRLPVVDGAKANVLNVKDSICSAVDVMQAMASSICLLSPKVGSLNSLVTEAANLRAKERVLLDDCKHLLSVAAAMQARECSLRTHILQSECSSQRGK